MFRHPFGFQPRSAVTTPLAHSDKIKILRLPVAASFQFLSANSARPRICLKRSAALSLQPGRRHFCATDQTRPDTQTPTTQSTMGCSCSKDVDPAGEREWANVGEAVGGGVTAAAATAVVALRQPLEHVQDATGEFAAATVAMGEIVAAATVKVASEADFMRIVSQPEVPPIPSVLLQQPPAPPSP